MDEEGPEEAAATKERLHEMIDEFLEEQVLSGDILNNEELADNFIIGMTPNSLSNMLHACLQYIEDTMFEDMEKEKDIEKIPTDVSIH